MNLILIVAVAGAVLGATYVIRFGRVRADSSVSPFSGTSVNTGMPLDESVGTSNITANPMTPQPSPLVEPTLGIGDLPEVRLPPVPQDVLQRDSIPPDQPIVDTLGPNWKAKVETAIRARAWICPEGQKTALERLAQTERDCARSWDMCRAWTMTWANSRGLVVIDRNCFFDRWKNWVLNRINEVNDIVTQLTFRNRYSDTFQDSRKLIDLAVNILAEVRREGFACEELFYGVGATDYGQNLAWQDVLAKAGWNIPLEKITIPNDDNLGYQYYNNKIRCINNVIWEKWSQLGGEP